MKVPACSNKIISKASTATKNIGLSVGKAIGYMGKKAQNVDEFIKKSPKTQMGVGIGVGVVAIGLAAACAKSAINKFQEIKNKD